MPIHRCRGALFSAGLLLLSGCYEDPQESEAGAGAIPAVEAVQARFGPMPLVERFPGVIKARNQVAIRSELSARVAEVFARSGDAVSEGEPLVRLEDAALSDQLRQADASLRLAEASARQAQARIVELEAQVRRSRVLVEESLISDLELETQEAQLDAARAGAEQAAAAVEQARATVEERRTALGKTLVRAPVTGRVGERDVEVGSLVDSGTVLFVIGDLGELRVEISLTQSMLGYVREGQTALVSAPVLGENALTAQISRISPFLAAGSFSTLAEIDIGNPENRLRPGMFVTVDVLYGESAPAAQVPATAVWEDPRSGVEGLYVVAGDLPAAPAMPTGQGAGPEAAPGGEAGVEHTVDFRPVEILTEGRGAAAVRGVEEGEWVVTVGQHLLRAGQPMTARVHPSSWESVLALQELQREDVLRDFLAKQRASARSLGSRPPTKEEVLERLGTELGGGAAGPGAGAD